MSKKYVVKSDKKLNPALKKQIVGVRSGMLGQCNKIGIPRRFMLTMSKELPGGIIKDKLTGRSTTHVSLYALGDVKQALKELFG